MDVAGAKARGRKGGDGMNSKAIEIAVELWKSLLANPKYDNMGDTGSPEERRRMGTASTLASMIPKNNTRDRLEAFGEALTRILRDNPKSCQCGDTIILSVDYNPNRTLAQAATEAGLKMEWPWKTVMWIKDDSVKLRSGYAAEAVVYKTDDPLSILAAKSWPERR